MGAPSIIGTHVRLELHKLAQAGRQFHVEDVVDAIMAKLNVSNDSFSDGDIILMDFPITVAENEVAQRAYIRKLTRDSLRRSRNKVGREFVPLSIGNGMYCWQHVSNLDMAGVSQVIYQYDQQITQLTTKRNYWQNIQTSMNTVSKKNKNVRAGHVMDWLPARRS